MTGIDTATTAMNKVADRNDPKQQQCSHDVVDSLAIHLCEVLLNKNFDVEEDYVQHVRIVAAQSLRSLSEAKNFASKCGNFNAITANLVAFFESVCTPPSKIKKENEPSTTDNNQTTTDSDTTTVAAPPSSPPQAAASEAESSEEWVVLGATATDKSTAEAEINEKNIRICEELIRFLYNALLNNDSLKDQLCGAAEPCAVVEIAESLERLLKVVLDKMQSDPRQRAENIIRFLKGDSATLAPVASIDLMQTSSNKPRLGSLKGPAGARRLPSRSASVIKAKLEQLEEEKQRQQDIPATGDNNKGEEKTSAEEKSSSNDEATTDNNSAAEEGANNNKEQTRTTGPPPGARGFGFGIAMIPPDAVKSLRRVPNSIISTRTCSSTDSNNNNNNNDGSSNTNVEEENDQSASTTTAAATFARVRQQQSPSASAAKHRSLPSPSHLGVGGDSIDVATLRQALKNPFSDQPPRRAAPEVTKRADQEGGVQQIDFRHVLRKTSSTGETKTE